MKGLGRTLAGVASAGILALAAAGCGDDDDGGGDGRASAQPPAAGKLAIELSGSAKKPTFEVPRSVEGGVVEISFTNSAKGAHSAQLVRAEQGHTPEEALAAGNAWGEKGKPLPDWALTAGGLGDVEPGQTATVTQELTPGKYLVADLESGANAEFEVTGGSGAGELPSGGGTIKATEYGFTASGLKTGGAPIRFDNAGGEPHFIAAVGIKQGKSLADVRSFFETEKGEPPLDESRGFSTAVIEGGESQSIDVELERGSYALLCWVPDRAGGPPHAVKGMVSKVTVGG
jgi:hypothetical protein